MVANRQCPPPLSAFSSNLWIHGPSNASGTVLPLSQRPNLCMSVLGSEAVVGSSDHALYAVNLTAGKLRILYGKSYGHTEWVTCVDHLPDGRIISGGMDSKLCLWERTGVRSSDLKGHTASISAVKIGLGGSVAVSSSYDRSLMLWDVSRPRGKVAGRLEGHRGAVMAFSLGAGTSIASGCRDGEVILWDGGVGSAVLYCRKAHEGHVTAVVCINYERVEEKVEGVSGGALGELFLTGGQDGVLKVWDFRKKGPVHSAIIHSSAKGKGAISCIGVSKKEVASGYPLVVTASADRLMKVLDPRSSFKVLHALEGHRDFIYSLFVSGSLAWSGGGDGSVLVHDLMNGECLYGLGAISNGAVRCISLDGMKSERLICTGDDGNAIVYSI